MKPSSFKSTKSFRKCVFGVDPIMTNTPSHINVSVSFDRVFRIRTPENFNALSFKRNSSITNGVFIAVLAIVNRAFKLRWFDARKVSLL